MQNKNTRRILIATGIYPPDIGGPAQYAYELERVWQSEGYAVSVKHFSFEKKLSTGLRHIFYLLKSLPALIRADYILVLDTWSVAFPIAIGTMILGKKFIVRVGGDFLWESYVERTKQKILLRDFYGGKRDFNLKERFIFKMTRWILSKAHKIVFSTDWQRKIWTSPYHISGAVIIENYYGDKVASAEPKEKVFLGATRNLVWKNLDSLKDVFNGIGAKLDVSVSKYPDFIKRVKASYAVILVSLGDISPNMIIDAIQCGKPFIVTREIGIYERIKDIAIFVDPLNTSDIKAKVLWLCDEQNYNVQKQKVESFSFHHSWKEIGNEFLKSMA